MPAERSSALVEWTDIDAIDGSALESMPARVAAFEVDAPERLARPVTGFSPRERLDPRHVFLDARAVMRRYGWGKTKGYQNLKDRELIPPPVITHPDRWRLDQLLAMEDERIEAANDRRVDPHERPNQRLESRLPAPKRSRRRSA